MKIYDLAVNNLKQLTYQPTIVFAEGWNPIIQQAVQQLAKENIIKPLVIMQTENQAAAFRQTCPNVDLFVIENNDLTDYANLLYELRKSKGLTLEQAQQLVKQPNYLTALMVKKHAQYGGICGIEYTTKDTLRAALQVIKTKPGVKAVSSIMILERTDCTLFLSDISLIINPDAEQLAQITANAINYVTKSLQLVNNNVALLSYSTNGSGAGESVDKVKKAYELYLANYPANEHAKVYGEIQFDAAFDPNTRSKKCPQLDWQGYANILVCPNLDVGNIAYKMLQRLAGFDATGPIILGLDKPMNDLSRGAGLYEVVSLAYLTAMQTADN